MWLIYAITHYGLPAMLGALIGLGYNLLAKKNNALVWASAGAAVVVVLGIVIGL